MKPLFNLIKKELRELLTPSSIISVLAVVIIFIAMGTFVGGEMKDEANLHPVAITDLTAVDGGTDYSGNAVVYLKNTYASQGFDPAKFVVEVEIDGYGTAEFEKNVLNTMREKGIDSVIVITPDFNMKLNSLQRANYIIYWNQDSTGLFSSLDTVSATSAIGTMNSSISNQLLRTVTSDENIINLSSMPATYDGSTYLKGELKQGVSPSQIYSALSQQTMFVPMVVMLIIIMIGSILISSMGNEKENKTLETLLTLPISRSTVVAGKLIGSAIAGLILGSLYMVGMYFYVNGMTSSLSSGVTLEQLGLVLSAVDWIVVVICVFLAILCALSICMILGAFAKNYKVAQTYIMPIAVLAVIPMIVTMFSSFGSLPSVIQAILFIIPFTHPMMVIQNLMFGDVALVASGIIYMTVFASVMIYITVRLYKSDILLTGLLLKKKKAEKEE